MKAKKNGPFANNAERADEGDAGSVEGGWSHKFLNSKPKTLMFSLRPPLALLQAKQTPKVYKNILYYYRFS